MRDSTSDLLIEIGCEELPPTALQGLSEAFARGVLSELDSAGIAHEGFESFASPRRLAVQVSSVAPTQPPREIVRRGPALSAAFDPTGSPTKAAEGFARSCGVAVAELERESTAKGEWLSFRTVEAGEHTPVLLPRMVEAVLGRLPIPKRMRWGSGEAEFVRPVHWVCILLGGQLVEGAVLEVAIGRQTRGHRFHHPDWILLTEAGEYARRLREVGYVEPSFAARRESILKQVHELAAASGLAAVVDEDLVDEVSALVEWPRAFVGRFDPAFLEVPSEALVETMQSNQKYFPLRTSDGALAPAFVGIANIESRDPAQVVAGNERVIRPRFADAKFFWEQDLKAPLQNRFTRLESAVFQERLGSIGDKSRRVAALAVRIAEKLGADAGAVERAALLSKCDLVTSMVFEFPTLQGIMGRHYASRQGELPAVCEALEEQYLPRFAGDRLPSTECGRILGLADRLDTLVGVFGVGSKPTGTKDPYGLRRASLAVLRILIETPIDLDLAWGLDAAAEGLASCGIAPQASAMTLEYVSERLQGYYQEQGIGADVVDAVIAIGETNPHLVDRRIRAVDRFRRLPAAVSLAAANKRIRNILTKEAIDAGALPPVRSELLADPAEEALWSHIQALDEVFRPALEQRNYVEALSSLAGLRDDVDRFFDQVMVMADDPRVRQNRQALISAVLSRFLDIADVSLLQPVPQG